MIDSLSSWEDTNEIGLDSWGYEHNIDCHLIAEPLIIGGGPRIELRT